MKNRHEKIRGLDKVFRKLYPLKAVPVPEKGWLNEIRTLLNMPTRYVAERIKDLDKKKAPVSAQAIVEFEKNEANGTISLNSLRKVADAMGMELVYGFVPKKEKTFLQMLYYKAKRQATRLFVKMSPAEKKQVKGFSTSNKVNSLTYPIYDEVPKAIWK